MTMNEQQEQMEKTLCKSLHYRFDEDACVSTLDIKKSAANLIANGVLLPASENFIFHDGCLAQQDFYRLVGACKDIGAMIWDAPTCGFTENGVDYLPVDIMCEPEEIEAALRIILSFLQPGKQEHA